MYWPHVPSDRYLGLPAPPAGPRGAVKVWPNASSRACSDLSAGAAVSDGVPTGALSSRSLPCDETLGVQPSQRTSRELQALGWALAVFVPFATAARRLGWYSGGVVSPRAVWCWVQAAGHQAMAHLQVDLETVATGHRPTPEPLADGLAALPLALGADGVLVPFRPEGGKPRGKLRWREIKGGGWPAWASIARAPGPG